MTRKLVFALPFAFLAINLSTGLAATASGRPDMAVEYDQVRRIALRDPKIQRAFEKANQQLEQKIVELDPALVDYRPFRRADAAGESRAARAEPARVRPVAAFQAATPKPIAKPAPRPAVVSIQKKHTIQTGETLGSVAAKYHVSVKELRNANRILDDRKLSIGQVLVIPGTKGGL